MIEIHRQLTVVLLSFVMAGTVAKGGESDDSKCGPRSLLAIYRMFGIEVDLDTICKAANWTASGGTTMSGLQIATRSFGLHSIGLRCTLETLRTLGVPAVAHLAPSHFVAVHRFQGNKVLITDPPFGRRLVPVDLFESRWDGSVLAVADESERLEKIVRDLLGKGLSSSDTIPRTEFQRDADGISAIPSFLFLGTLRRDLFVTRELNIQSSNSDSIIAESAADCCLELEVIRRNGGFLLKVSVRPWREGVIADTVLISSVSSGSTEVRVPVYGFVMR